MSTWTCRNSGNDVILEIIKVDYLFGYAIYYVRASEQKVEVFKRKEMLELLVFNQN